MTEEEKLISESENSQWFALLQLADLMEEQGNTNLAMGYRFLAERRLYPLQARKNGKPINFWSWGRGERLGYQLIWSIHVICKRKTSTKGPGILLKKAAEAAGSILAKGTLP